MGKQKETYMILREMSKSDIKTYAGDLWFKRVWWKFGLWWVFLLGVLSFVLKTTEIADNVWVMVAIGVVVWLMAIVPFSYLFNKWGQFYWDKVKDKEQPISLEKMPSWWRDK